MRKVVIIDTSILCVWLDVPGMTTCGPQHDCWDRARVSRYIDAEKQADSTLVLPLATIIETGNHIANAASCRYECGQELAALIRNTADGVSPWAVFTAQHELWSAEKLRALADAWPALAAKKLSLGDATIKDIAEQYARSGCQVEILTGDQGLKAYEPIAPPEIPRRRR